MMKLGKNRLPAEAPPKPEPVENGTYRPRERVVPTSPPPPPPPAPMPDSPELSVIVAVDSAQRANGVCYGVTDPFGHVDLRTFTIRTIDGIERIEADDHFRAFCEEHGHLRLCAVLECPSWSGHGTKEVRSAAIAWERVLHRRFRNRNIHRVDPRVWQSMLLAGLKGALGTKSASMIRAESLGLSPQNDDEADAACLAEYASFLLRGLITEEERKHRSVPGDPLRQERRAHRSRRRRR